MPDLYWHIFFIFYLESILDLQESCDDQGDFSVLFIQLPLMLALYKLYLYSDQN